jgi:hypothetical protein
MQGEPVKSARPKRRGRPRAPGTTELIRALIARQDAMARRTAEKIATFLAAHVEVAVARARWRRIVQQARAALLGEESEPVEIPPSTLEPPPIVRRSQSLAAARAQNARLGARWIDLRGRVVVQADTSTIFSSQPIHPHKEP